MKMDTMQSSEMPENNLQSTRLHIPEDCNVSATNSETLKRPSDLLTYGSVSCQ